MKSFFNQLSKAGFNGFFFCLMAMVLLAWWRPEYGSAKSTLHLKEITQYGVAAIFFLYGLKLSPEKLKTGLRNWKIHALIQITTFILFPTIAWIIVKAYGDASNLLWVGFFYLAALPSTVSSSVVMVSIARGNVPAAIFNASISSILGIFITPLWMSLYTESSNDTTGLTDIIVKLCLQILLPVTLGLLLHSRFGSYTEKYRSALRNFDQFIILLIVYTAFSESFLGNMFSGFTFFELALLSLAMLIFFLVMVSLMYFISLLLKFPGEDRITILFCGSKKSLVQGAVFGKVLFPDPLSFGLILLPLMLYHALQLLAGSAIAQALSNKSN